MPQPNVTKASENTSMEVSVTGKNEAPLQSCKKVHHHIRSALAPALRQRKWWGALFSERSEKSCQRKTQPCRITVAARDRWPKRDMNCDPVSVQTQANLLTGHSPQLTYATMHLWVTLKNTMVPC